MSVVIRNTTVPDGRVIDVLLVDGKINSIGENLDCTDIEEYDASGMNLLPGAIDPHTHIRDMELEKKETWLTGSKAAAAGGVTTIFDMPNTKPETIDVEALEKKMGFAAHSIVNFGFYGGATGANGQWLAKEKRIVGVKAYLGASTGDLLNDSEADQRKIFALPRIIVVHAEHEKCLQASAAKWKGKDLVRYHTRMRPVGCAERSVRESLALAVEYGTRIHVTHSTTAAEVIMVMQAQENGLRATIDHTLHHMYLSEFDMRTLGALGKMNPPLRSEKDRQAVYNSVRRGFGFVATDHAPHTLAEKEGANPPSGVPGLDHVIPMLATEAYKGNMSWERVVDVTSGMAAELLDLHKGRIQVGYDADVVLVKKEAHKLQHSDVHTKCGWTPFAGRDVEARVVATFVGGNKVYENGTFFLEQKGSLIHGVR